MTVNQWLNFASAATIFAYGLACLFTPMLVARVVHHQFPDGRGVAEFRINQGGKFIGFGLAAMIIRDPLVYRAFAALWFGAGITRVIVAVIDRPKLTPEYIGLALGEFMFAAMALA
jgi:hypothetical protein